MSGRTPSFIVVGLVIIMFLLGFFYMSCSSKNTELRSSLEQFEDQIRSLTLKNRDAEKKIDSLITRKRELEEEKLTIQRQMEKKDSEINDLNTKLNERAAEIQRLRTDTKVIEEQLKESKTLGETIGSKNSLIEKLQQQINEQKQVGVNEQGRLKDEIEGLKSRLSNNVAPTANNGSADTLLVPHERFAPRFSNNQTTRSIASFFRNPRDDSTNSSREVKPKIVQAGLEMNGNVLNVSPEQKNQSNIAPANEFVGQNVPPPLLASNDSRNANQPVESAQGPPRLPRTPNQDGVVDPNPRQLSPNNGSLNKPNANDLEEEKEEVEDEEGDGPADNNALPRPAEPAVRSKIVATEPVAAVDNANRFAPVDRPRLRSRDEETGRIGNRERFGRQRKSLRRNRLANNEENDDEGEQRQIGQRQNHL